jgi:hypothetical protein
MFCLEKITPLARGGYHVDARRKFMAALVGTRRAALATDEAPAASSIGAQIKK